MRVNQYRTILVVLLIARHVASSQNSISSIVDTNMVLVPGGEFVMGKDGEDDFSPAHRVMLDSFYIDKYEATNLQYYRFCQATGHQMPDFWGMKEYHCGIDFPNHPVVGVSCSDAIEYARWAGKRLPTEAEWECAAKGGLIDSSFPNGDYIDTTLANMTFKGRRKGTVQVGSYKPNTLGVYDMAGNVCEWVADIYGAEYYEDGPKKNPKGPDKGRFRVIRGGGWHSGSSCNRVYYRNALPSNWVDFAVGFRCAKDIKQVGKPNAK